MRFIQMLVEFCKVNANSLEIYAFPLTTNTLNVQFFRFNVIVITRIKISEIGLNRRAEKRVCLGVCRR
jgi:hypothetical protein